MNRTKAVALATALLAGVVTIAGASSASADFVPQSRDVVGVGSDTIQYALNNLADGATIGSTFTSGYNLTAGARLVSFNALNPSVAISDTTAIHDMITLKVGTTPITRPDGSGAGKATLFGTGNNAAVDFARSSSALNAAEVTGGLKAYPFALDQLAAAVSAQGTNAPAAISVQQLVSIYSGAVTNWSQIGGLNGVIIPEIPQAGSGTRTFFEAQLATANGGVAVNLATTVVEVQEHDPSVFTAAPNVVAPFSIGRAAMPNATSLVHIETGTASDGNASFTAKRAVYNVVRGTDVAKGYVGSLFGASGFLCGSGAQSLIEAAGLKQLAAPVDGGVCGQQYATTTGVSNFTVNP